MNRRFAALRIAVLALLGLPLTWHVFPPWDERHASNKTATTRVLRGMASWAPPPPTLSHQCRAADTIVVAGVIRIARQSHVPENHPRSDHVATVFSVGVERYLRSTGAPQQPPVLDVWQHGGAFDGLLRITEEDPLLSVGSRYLLFLKTSDTPENRLAGGLTWMVDGVAGIGAHLDEYRVTEHLTGKVLLIGGRTALPQDPNLPNLRPWRFRRDGDTLLNLPEEEAIERVRLAVGAL